MLKHSQLLTFCLLLACTISSLARGESLDEREWKQVTSENFRVNTVLNEKRATELLRQLEVMRAALGSSDAAATYQAAVPTVIIALDNAADYQLIGAPETTVGYFMADQRENAILIQDDEYVQGVQVILHEYVHYLHRKNGRVMYPEWFEEGNAEYLSSSQILDDSYDFGLPHPGRLTSLRFSAWLPMSEILEMTDLHKLDVERGDLFYSQSWLLVHYLNNRPQADQELPEMLRQYGKLVVDGTNRSRAFELAFGLDVDELGDKLLHYVLANDFQTKSLPIKSALPDFSTAAEPLSTAKVQVALGQMAMRFQNDEAAERWFTLALEDEDTRPQAEAGMGTVYGFRGEVAKASARFEAAIALVSYDFRMWMDYAQFWANRVSAAHDHEKRLFYAGRLEESLRNALTIADATPELNTLLGFAYLAQGKDTDEAIEYLIAATEESPTDQATRMMLAGAYQYAGKYHLAIDTAESVLSFEHDQSEMTVAAQAIIDESWKALDWPE